MAKKSSRLTLRGPEGGWAGAAARAKQILAGAIEGTIANTSETQGNYRPAIVDSLPALPAVIGSLVNQRKDGKPFSGDTAVERYLNDSLRRANLGSERTNKTLGISQPKNTAELALRVGGGFAVPMPKGATASRIVEALPKGERIVEAAVKAAKATPKLVKTPLKVAAEIAVPLRQTSIKTAAPIGVGVTGALDALLDQTVDPSTGVKYNGTVPELLGVDTATPIEEQEDELDNFVLNTAVETGDISADDLDDLMASPATEEESEVANHEFKLGKFGAAATAMAAALAAPKVVSYAKTALGARFGASVAEENIGQFSRFTGKKYTSSRLGRKDKVVTELFEQDRPIRSMAEEYLGRDYAERWGFRADAMTNASIQSRVRGFFETGRAPNSALRSEKLAPLAEAYAKELSPDEQILVSDALNAASALDDFKRTGTLASMTKDRAGNPQTPKQLEALVHGVTSDPKLNKYYGAVQKSYDDLARYRVLRGRDSLETYQQLRKDRPNYVPHNRNFEPDVAFSPFSQRYSANADQGFGSARSTDEGGGITGTTGVGNPVVSLFDEWAGEIRRSELNELRADFLTNMEATGARNAQGYKIIEKVTPNSKGEDVHQVRVRGHTEAYRVRDPEVARALHFSPRLSMHVLEAMRQMQQNLTTGPIATLFNFFGVAAAPVFDSMAGAMLRGKGVKIGAANRLFVGGHLGAVRYMWDDIRGAVGRTLRDNAIRDNSFLKDLIGPTNVDNLATHFENAYENTVKAEMDQLGITSHTMYGSPDPSQLLSGVEQLSPHFARATGKALRADVAEEVDAGHLSALRGALKTSGSAFAQAKTNAIIRAYTHVMEAMHNGARYTAYAANRGRKGTDLPKLVSDMRRLSADASKHGASDTMNVLTGANMYAPIAMQTMFEVGRRFRESPSNMMFNTMTTGLTAAALLYTSLAYDEDALKRHMAKTPQQKATSLSLFGGVEMKLDPLMRLVLGATMPIYDQMSGLTQGQFDPNFLHVMSNWLDGSAPDMDEASEKDLELRVKKGVEDNVPFSVMNPFNPNFSSLPVANIGAAFMGVDPGLSRITGETAVEREQQLTGMDEGVRRPDSLVSAHTENMITSIFSTVGRSMLGIADDAYRAMTKDASGKQALDMAAQSWKNQGAKTAGVAQPLFGNYESIHSASDLNYELMKDREPGIEQAIKVFNKDYRGGGITSTTNKKAVPLPTEEGVTPPEVEGTELAYISEMANQLESMWLKKNREVLGRLGKEVEAFGSQYKTRIEDRNKRINALNEERKYQRMLMLTHTRKYEELISERIGKPFSFEDFKPDDHLTPLVPENQ